MINIGKWAIGIAIAATPLYSSALTVVVDGQTYLDVPAGNITFTENGLKISTSGSGSGGGDSGSGGDSGGSDSGSGGDSGGGDSGSGGSSGGGDSGGGSDELPDGAVFKKSYDLANPPGSQQIMTIGSRTQVFRVEVNVPSGKRAVGSIHNAYSALNPGRRRMWLSNSPAGAPLDGGSVSCDTRGGQGFSLEWIVGSRFSGYCPLTSGQTYYLNVEKVISSSESSRYIMNLKANIY